MRRDSLDDYQAHVLAMKLFDCVVQDMSRIANKPLLYKLVSQQLGSADSIAANIEEGFGRETTKEFIRFLVIARGSARETRGRYLRLNYWFPPETIEDRCRRCEHIIGILTRSITTLQKR